MPISTVNQKGLDAPLTLTSPTLTSPIITGSTPQVTVLTSGSGTYTVPTNARFLLVKMAGAGGGGGGSGAGGGGGGAGGTGGTTTFGSSLLTCTGGTGGVWGGAGTAGGDGGTATIGSGASGVAVTGNAGNQYPGGYNSTNVYTAGSLGGTSPLGRSGYGGSSNGAGGQGGGSSGTAIVVGTGGGAGGYIEAYVSPLSATYAYSIGTGGTAGTAGTSGFVVIAGGNGIIFITAFF
jgi:hypothetical protein